MADTETLRAQLLETPEDWGVRLRLAALLEAGSPQEAALTVATAPGDPEEGPHAVEAARILLEFDADHAARLMDRVLAKDPSSIEALILRARLHQQREEVANSRRFATAAMMVDRERLAQEVDLLDWLAKKGAGLAGFESSPSEQEAAEPLAVIPEEDEIPVLQALEASESVREERHPSEIGATWHESAEPMVRTPPPVEKPSAPQASATPVPRPVKKVETEQEDHEPAEVNLTQAEHRDSAEPESAASEESESPSSAAPAQRRLAAQKMSAFTVAVLVHALLTFLLGAIAVIVPEPKVAELVGIVSPEAEQEVPQNKKVVPTSMPNPAVSVSPARFVTATGMSSVSLPSFEADTTDPLATDIATTDLGASFAMPFAGKGTSQVNFFGIKSAGKRVAFLIDAERYMLTDPRGGYPAYQIVKEEIAGMIGMLGLETRFNVILFNEGDLSAFSERLLPATAANKAKVADWLEPVNREYEKLGLRAIKYPLMKLKSEVEPVQQNYLRGYLRAIQCALELDVDNVFIICSGYRGMWVPRDPEEYERLLKRMRWTEKDDKALADAHKEARDWLNKENEKRREKGIPERVVISLNEIMNELGLRPRRKPGGIQITPEEREDQVQNAVRLHYLSNGKPKPKINFVIFIGKDQDKRRVPQLDHFKNIARRAKAGKVRVLEGLAALENVTGRK